MFDALTEQYDGGDDLPEEVDARLCELETAIDAFINRPTLYGPDEMARAGVLIKPAAGQTPGLRLKGKQMGIQAKFTAGDLFPAFTWPSAAGGQATPADTEGWRLIVIYRGKHCPLCKQYLATLESLKADYEAAGISVWALSSDPVERAQEDASAQGWTFPLLAGLGEEQMRQLGLYMSSPRSPSETDRNFAEPAIFVLNPQGRVQIIDLSNAPFVRPDLKALLGGLRYIMANDYPVRGTAD